MTANITQHKKVMFFTTILLTSFIGALWVMKDYLSVIALSLIFAVIVHPIYEFIHLKFKIKRGIASLLTIIISFFLIILPVILSINLFAQELGSIIASYSFNKSQSLAMFDDSLKTINAFLASIPFVQTRIDITSINQVIADIGGNLSNYILDRAVAIGTSSVQFIINFFIFLILTYFSIPQLSNMRKYMLKLSPLEDKIDEIYINRLIALVVSTMKSIFIIALAQGLLGGLFIWIAGSSYILTFTILMIILSIIPIVGTGFVTVPIGLYMLAQGNYPGAAIVLLGQAIFVSNIDNILRAQLLSKDTSLHPAIMLMGIFGGLSVFGVLGFIYGPIVLIFFLTSLEIYTKHYKL